MRTIALNIETILMNHLTLCEEVLRVITQENALLKSNPENITEDYLEEKSNLLARIEHSVKNLKEINEHGSIIDGYLQTMISKAQKVLMKIFLLDRENERLLLQSSFRKKTSLTTRPSASRIRNVYNS